MKTLSLILSIIPSLIKIIAAVEEVFPQSGAGSAKLAMVKDILSKTCEGLSDMMPSIEAIINVVVSFANAIGAFKKTA